MTHARRLVAGLTTLVAIAAAAGDARAQGSYSFTFNGPGVAGSVLLTYGPATDAKYPSAFKVTSVSGTFTDTNNGLNIVNASIGALVPATRSTPEPTNLLAPDSFTRFPVATGLPFGSLSFDNLFWPGGSPQTATDYPVSGGFLDIYGLLFEIGGGRVVNLWSNGDFGSGTADYGAAVVTSSTALDYVEGGVAVAVTPEPGVVWLVGVGGAGLLATAGWRRRRSTAA